MKKWIVPLLSSLLVTALLLISSPLNIFKASMANGGKEEKRGIFLIQVEGKEEQTDPHFTLVLKRLREKLDKWIKSLNDRIENEDITRLEVRFLEILRSTLGWVREKVNAKIESSEKGKPKETHQRTFSFAKWDNGFSEHS